MAARSGYGTQFLRETSPGVFELVAGVTQLGALQLNLDTTDTTTYDGDGFRTKMGTLFDPGEMSLTLNWDPNDSGHASLLDDFLNKRQNRYRIELPEGLGRFEFVGVITQYPLNFPLDDKLSADVNIAISGKPLISI
jgi:hypothetical protein